VQVEQNTVVIYDCTVHDEAGDLVQASAPDDPLRWLAGASGLMPAVSKALMGRRASERVEIVAEPVDAMGERDPSLVRTVPRSGLAGAVVGSWVQFMERWSDDSERLYTGTVVSMTEDTAVLDANHALAGQRLQVVLEVRAVRAATQDELRAGSALGFPFDVFAHRGFPGELGRRLRDVEAQCMFPPYPWGQWLYGRLLDERCARLDGDLIELGVGLGGTSLFIAEWARDHGRRVWCLDTFAGLPPGRVEDNPYFLPGVYRGQTPLLPRFEALVAERGLGEVVETREGLFADTLPQLPEGALCFAHLDSDRYETVLDSLEGVWDRLVDGGLLVVDDFFHHAQGPARACPAFFNARGLAPVFHVSFPYSVVVVKGETAAGRGGRSLDGNVYSFAWMRADETLRAVVAASLAREAAGTRSRELCAGFAAFLAEETARTSDVYVYWAALEAFWDGLAHGFGGVLEI
jgi:FKBP-type peptidyl-prolyl cis-trans isomerase 2